MIFVFLFSEMLFLLLSWPCLLIFLILLKFFMCIFLICIFLNEKGKKSVYFDKSLCAYLCGLLVTFSFCSEARGVVEAHDTFNINVFLSLFFSTLLYLIPSLSESFFSRSFFQSLQHEDRQGFAVWIVRAGDGGLHDNLQFTNQSH